jgi:hypothetical protein
MAGITVVLVPPLRCGTQNRGSQISDWMLITAMRCIDYFLAWHNSTNTP